MIRELVYLIVQVDQNLVCWDDVKEYEIAALLNVHENQKAVSSPEEFEAQIIGKSTSLETRTRQCKVKC